MSARKGENMEERYLYKAKRLDKGEWVTGSVITCEDGTYKIATSCLEGKVPNIASKRHIRGLQ